MEEKNNHASSSLTPVAKSVASLVMIDSISIDLGKAMDKEVTEKCHHFSLRGYVADMRIKNVRVCAPFACDGDDETKLREQLVPLHVPKFRWWCFQSCVQDTSASESQQNIEKASTSSLRGEIHPSPSSNNEKNDALMGLTAVPGPENGVKDSSDQQICDQTLSVGKCRPGTIPERNTYETGVEELTRRELASTCVVEPASNVARRDVLAVENPGKKSSSSGDLSLAEKAATIDEDSMIVVIDNHTSNNDIEIDASTSVKDAGATKKDSYTSRKKKMRLLAELLNGNDAERSDQLASNSAMPNECAALTLTSAKRKRNVAQEPSNDVQLLISAAKKARACDTDAKTTIATIHNSDSESEEDDASAGTDFRSHMPLQKTGNGPCSSKLKTIMSSGEERQGSFKSMLGGSYKEDIGLDLSLNSYMEVEKINSIVPPKKTMRSNGHWMKGICTGESSAADLCLSKDIEEDISGKIASAGKQQENSLSLCTKLDLSLGCSNKKTTEPKMFPEDSRNNTGERSETVLEQRSYDDIPMEIVELMAKHQYERGLSEAERNSCLAKRIDERSYEMMGFADVHGNRMRPLQKEHNKWNPVDLSQAKNTHFVVGNRDESHVLPVFGTCPQTLLKESVSGQASASRTFIKTDTQNRLWSGDRLVHRSSPTDTQVIDTYNTAHNGPQHSGMAGNIWACGASSLVPLKHNFSKNIANGTSNMATYLPSPDRHKGKTVRDLDLNRADPNDSDVEVFLVCPSVANNIGRDLNLKERESLHSFPNEAIPAMQLLSLMDAGKQPRAPFSIDAKKVLERPFFPCNNHPNLGMDERANLCEKPLFPQNHRLKEYFGSGPSVYKSSASTTQMPSAYCGPNILSSQQPEKANRGGVPDMIRNCNPHQAKQKGFLGASVDVVFPSQQNALKISENRRDIGSCHIHGTLMSLRDISKEEVCSVSRNPADFTIPEAGNMYMIRGGDLKFSQDFSRSRINPFVGQKRHRSNLTAPTGQAVGRRPTVLP